MGIEDWNITVVGLGLIGGSYAISIKEKLRPKNLWAIDIDEATLALAEKKGVIDKGFVDGEIPLKDSDLVILSLYPELTLEFIEKNMRYFKSGAIITDTSGVKEKIVDSLNRTIREDLDFIGGHPMAGRELSGFKASSSKIFQGANYILTPSSRNLRENIESLKKLIFKIGFQNILELTPEEHDKVIAFTSHLPHIIASLLVNNSILQGHQKCVGGSFIDATRVAKINSELWSELLLCNSNNIIELLSSFEQDIEIIRDLIINKDKNNLKKIFDQGRKRREELELS